MAIKFISLNMWNGGVLMEGLLDFLVAQDADVVLLQEVYDGTNPGLPTRYRSLETLLSRLPYTHHDFVADYLERDDCRRGNAILSKHPIGRRSALFYDKPYSETYVDGPENAHNLPRNIQYALVNTPEHDVHVFNIHGVWDLDGNNFSEARQLMGEAMVASVKDKRKVVLAGDTNALPTNRAIQHMKPHVKSVFEGHMQTSFNLKRKTHPGYATSVVDMLFTDHETQVLSRECPAVDISDHLPLVATLEFGM